MDIGHTLLCITLATNTCMNTRITDTGVCIHTPMHAVEVSNVLALTVQVIVFPLVQVFKAASSSQATIMGSLGGPNKAIIAPKKEPGIPNQPQVGGELDSDCCSGLSWWDRGQAARAPTHPHSHPHKHTHNHFTTQEHTAQ